jgi:hypothetical protein
MERLFRKANEWKEPLPFVCRRPTEYATLRVCANEEDPMPKLSKRRAMLVASAVLLTPPFWF